MTRIPSNLSLRVALKLAAAAGATVEPVNATGEVRVGWPGERSTRVNVRRKDCPRRLLSMLRQKEVR